MMSKLRKSGGVGILAIILVITGAVGLVAWVFPSSGIKPGSVIPGFEGLHAGVDGVEIQGDYTELGAALPSSYRWVDASPSSAILSSTGSSFLIREGQVRIEVGTPREYSSPYTLPKSVDYWIAQGGSYVHVKGQIVEYVVGLGVSARDTGAPPLSTVKTFRGEKVWINLASVAWNKAVQEQTATGKVIMGTAWEAPLEAVITSYTQDDLGDHYYLDPAQTGRYISLYSTPDQVGTISDLLAGDVNATLSGDPSPDSRLTQSVFFPVTLTDYGTTAGLFQTYTPTTTYELHVYALRIGKYTYTNPDDTPFSTRPAENNTWDQGWVNVGQWIDQTLSNPWTWILIAASFTAVILILYFLTRLR